MLSSPTRMSLNSISSLPSCFSMITSCTAISVPLNYQWGLILSCTVYCAELAEHSSHWWSDWRRRRRRRSGQHPAGHSLPPRGRGWARSPADIYPHCLDALQMLGLLVVQWYSQWETLSGQKEEGKGLPMTLRLVCPPAPAHPAPPYTQNFWKLSTWVTLSMKILHQII